MQVSLTLDIGNTAIKCGLFEEDVLVHHFRLPSEQSFDYTNVFRSALNDWAGALKHIGFVSVVPALQAPICAALQDGTGLTPIQLTNQSVCPLKMGYHTPQTLGMDRLAGAMGAWVYLKAQGKTEQPVIVVDAGTAINYEVVSADGTYEGGAIAAGVDLMRKALARGTAQLPEVDPRMPDQALGRSTQTCLQSGIIFMLLDSVSGMLGRLTKEVEGDPLVIATGGWGALLAEKCLEVHAFEPFLVLKGIKSLLDLNAV